MDRNRSAKSWNVKGLPDLIRSSRISDARSSTVFRTLFFSLYPLNFLVNSLAASSHCSSLHL